MKIAVDAMGGDHGPSVVVEGAVKAAREYHLAITLVGQEPTIRSELARHNLAGLTLSVVHAPDVIQMTDEPAMAARNKPEASMNVAIRLVREGEADAFVTVGNTGAALATALFTLGRIKKVRRPALGTVYPTARGPCFLLDIGANTDCKPEWLVQFAHMGSAYAEKVLGIDRPRVALLSNGEEEGKGNQAVREAYQRLKQETLNFVGNVEGKDIPMGLADVVVSDGFDGNVVIKLSEGVAKAVVTILREEVRQGLPLRLGACLAPTLWLTRQRAKARGGKLAWLIEGAVTGLTSVLWPAVLLGPSLWQLRKRLDYAEYGGGALLGVEGVVIIGHGRSNAKAVKNAIRVAARAVEYGVVDTIRQAMQSN